MTRLCALSIVKNCVSFLSGTRNIDTGLVNRYTSWPESQSFGAKKGNPDGEAGERLESETETSRRYVPS